MSDGNRPNDSVREPYVERLIREARERGEFDNLPGEGGPIADLDQPHDEFWWLRKWIERENLSMMPEALELKRDIRKSLENIWKLPTENDVRRRIDALNALIRRKNHGFLAGAGGEVHFLNVNEVLQHWRLRRTRAGSKD